VGFRNGTTGRVGVRSARLLRERVLLRIMDKLQQRQEAILLALRALGSRLEKIERQDILGTLRSLSSLFFFVNITILNVISC
jgi:hypothetical protein